MAKEKPMHRYARIAVRPAHIKDPDKPCLILGMTNVEVFKPGHVYSITEILGEFIVKDLGPSAATAGPNGFTPQGLTWSRDASSLINDGNHLLTQPEYRFKCLQTHTCANCNHPGAAHVYSDNGIYKCLFGTGHFARSGYEGEI